MQFQCHICGGTYGLNPLPDDPVIAEKWKEALPDATPDVFNKDFRLCVLHFDPMYVFHRRYLLKMAVPDRLVFNGDLWVNENGSRASTASSHKVGYSLAAPRMINNSMNSVDESPVVLPLPPRREDEPDSDPLAIPDNTQVSKTPVITHVTSLRQPEIRASPDARSDPHKSHRSSNITGGSPSRRTPTHTKSLHHSMKSNSLHRPKISVRTPAQLSTVPAMLNSSNRSPSTPNILTTSQFTTVKTHQGVSISKQIQTIIVSPESKGAHHIPAPEFSSPLVQNQSHAKGTPSHVPDPNQKIPLVQNQSKLFVIENPRTLNTKPTDATSSPKHKRMLPKQLESTKKSNKSPLATERLAAMQKKLSANPKDTSQTSLGKPPKSPVSSADKAKFTERLAKQAIATTKADIEKSRQKSRVLRKKVDLLKLKVSTYEGLIAKLVGKNIISAESAKQCRLLEKDIMRYNKRRKSAPYTETQTYNANSFGKGTSDRSKENINDSVDLTTSKDHDYLRS